MTVERILKITNGLDFPQNELELELFNEAHKDFKHELDGSEIDPNKILERMKQADTVLKIELPIHKKHIASKFNKIVSENWKDAPKEVGSQIIHFLSEKEFNEINQFEVDQKLVFNTAFGILPKSIYEEASDENFKLKLKKGKESYHSGYYFGNDCLLSSTQKTRFECILELCWLFIIEPCIQRISE